MEPDTFTYELPAELIAQRPAARRTDARLLVAHRSDGSLDHRRIDQLGEVLRAGDLLVLNDSKVIAARVIGRRPTGGRLEVLFVRALTRSTWDVLVRGAPRVGEHVTLPEAVGRWAERRGDGRWVLEVEGCADVLAWLERVGSIPLPPYIRRPEGPEPDDATRYQTVVAKHPGAVAAPTAGLHFTRELLSELGARGIEHTTVTLHVGPGTFLPFRPADGRSIEVEPEWYCVPPETEARIGQARRLGGRVVAVGTTTCRALESHAAAGEAAPAEGWADLFIRPGHAFRVVDALVTNFHLPGTPLLALVAAFLGYPGLRAAYEAAIRQRYRFYSYGDAMVIV